MQITQVDNPGIRQELFSSLLKRKRPAAALRVTPMINVIFLLLTFFVLTARFRTPEQFLPVTLPGGASFQSIDVIEPLEIQIFACDTGCMTQIAQAESVLIETQAIDEGLSTFAIRLGEILRSQKRTAHDPVEITCGDDVKWDHLVKIYNVLSVMGVNNIIFTMTE